MAEAFIALGSNIGDSRAILEHAIILFCDDKKVRLTARSSDYRTAPWGITEQPHFINACIAVDTALSPQALLAHAHMVERELGRNRKREQRWGPRMIDIDLLTYDNLTLSDGDLILPHPRLLERAFVLAPLVEIAPNQQIGDVQIRDRLASLDQSVVEKLPPR